MHNKHILKWVLSSVAVLGVATVLVYNNSDYDSNVSKIEPKSDNLVSNASAESYAKAESKDSHDDPVEVSQTSRYEDLVSHSENSVLRPVVEQPRVEKPVEQPKVEKPVEQPSVEKPVEQPKVEKPVEQPRVEKPVEQPVVSQKGTPEVRQDLPEAVVTEKGTPEVQPALPEYVETQKGEPLVQPTLPEAVVTEKGTPEVQLALPQYVETQKGEPLVQPALSEAVVTEKGVPEVQPALPEAVVNDKGVPEVRPALNDYTLTTKTRKDVETIPTKFLNLGSIHMHEGERKKVIEGEPGSITKIYEDIIGPDGTVLKSTLKDQKIIDPIYHVYRYGVAPVNGKVGEDGLYRFSEHIDKIDVVAFNKGITLNGDQIKALGQNEITKRANQDVENNLWLANPINWTIVTVANAPLSDDSIKKLDNGTYINHKNVGLEMLKLVNAERKRLGKSQLKWSDRLYALSRIRAEEIRDNGHIRFFAANGDVLKHVRDDKGKSWVTVFDKTEFERRGVGENLAGFTLPRNIYKAFSEKTIAELLYNQWRNSPGHYANMIADAYTEFGFDMSYSKFWRNDRTSVDYLAQGIHGVQLFAI